MKFLYAAYTLVWIIFAAYAWSLGKRQAKLREDLDQLKRAELGSARPAQTPSSMSAFSK